MSTVSTKSRTDKRTRSKATVGGDRDSIRLNGESTAAPDLSERTDGAYQYDPANYHGPTLYYFAALIPWTLKFLFGSSAMETYGLNTVTIRLVPAWFGLATIWLVLLLRKRVGTIAALAAALLLAISPGAVYLSRYFIHETLFVFFTLATVVACLEFYEERNPVFLSLATISMALLFATKETAMISAAVLVISLVLTHLYRRLNKTTTGTKRSKRKRTNETKHGLQEFIEGLGGPLRLSLSDDLYKVVDVAGVSASLSGCRGRRLCCLETEEHFCPLHCALGLRVSGCLLPCALQDAVAHPELHRSTCDRGRLCRAIDL